MTDGAQQQPTILIKKADGTTERISLQEFQKRKALAANPAPVQKSVQPTPVQKPQPQPVQAPARRAISMVLEEPTVQQPPQPPRRPVLLVEDMLVGAPAQERRAVALIEDTSEEISHFPTTSTEQHIATVTPVTHFFAQPATAPRTVDHRSLLDEDENEILHIKEKHKTTHAPTTNITFSSSVSIPSDLEARTSALVLSWKKGIRDRNQFLEYAAKPAMQGGLGLSERDAEQFFMDISGTALLGKPESAIKPRPLVSSQASRSVLSSQPKKTPMNQAPQPASLIREIASTGNTTRVMGPVEEVASFTLEDLRRLSRDPKIASSMLLAKISGWKDESYLLYLQVRDSWKTSPLFRLYIEKTVEAIEKNISILSVLQGSELQYEEYIAIAEVNQKMGLMD